MVRRKTATAETTEEALDVFDQAIADRQAAAIVHDVAAATQMPESTAEDAQRAAAHLANPSSTRREPQHGHAAAVGKKQYTAPADPFGFENIQAGENRVRLLKSEGHQAWVVRFHHNPNQDKGPNGETYSKENPHPVLKMLKEEGYRWGFDNGDGQGGWGKGFTGDAYGQDHIDARRVLAKAAEMVGAPSPDQGRIPD